MDHELCAFLSNFLGVVAMTLIPVIVTAFLTMPFTLNRHPGEPPSSETVAYRHMT